MIPSPSFSASPEQYERAVRRVQSYIESTSRDNDARSRSHALFGVHLPGELVYGTVILIHGLASTPEIMRPTMTYLFKNGFNVYAPPGAGHAFHYSRFPHTVVSRHPAGEKAREAILQDGVLKAYFDKITNLAAIIVPPDMQEYSTIADRIYTRLEQSLSPDDFAQITNALELLSASNYFSGFETEIAKHFESDHQRYESHPFERLSDISALPGPVYVIGHALGAVQAINLAARAKFVDKLVLIAPFTGFAENEFGPQPKFSLPALGSLDLYSLPFPVSTVGARHLTAATVAACLLARDEIADPIRENTATFCIVSESDDACDPTHSLELYREKFQNQRSVEFMYPKVTGLKNSIYPSAENEYSTRLLQEIFRFLTTGKVHLHKMLEIDGDPKLPPVDPESLQISL